MVPNARVVLVELKGKLGLPTAIETVERADLIEFPGKTCESDMRDERCIGIGCMTHPFWKKRIYMHPGSVSKERNIGVGERTVS